MTTRLPGRIGDAATAFRSRLSRRFGDRLLRFGLFGSFARGDWGPDSDVDLLVVIAALTSKERKEAFDLGFDVYCETLVRLAPFVLADHEWQELGAREYRIAAEIEHDQVPL